MRTVIPPGFLSLLFGCAAACRPSASPSDGHVSDAETTVQLARSQSAWVAAKSAHGGHYAYARVRASAFGFGTKTTVEVRGDQVVKRTVETWGSKGERSERVERGADIGAAKDGEPPATMEALYEECRGVLARDPQKYAIQFSADTGGILTVCGAVPRGCQDDCFQGIAIERLDWSGDP